MKMISRVAPVLAFALSLSTLTGCSDSGDQARLTLQLTDSPGDIVGQAVVEIGEIRLFPQGGSPITLTENGGTHDLLQLQNGVTVGLASLDIPAGTYQELRMVVTSATVTLVDGLTFNDGTSTRSLTVPSGAQSGIKIKLRGADGSDNASGIEITQGETILVVDFDVSQNFVVQGNPDTPAGISGMLFTPSLRAVVRDLAASITGTVSSTSGASLAGITVTAEQTDAAVPEELQTTMASAVVDSTNGAYAIRFLAPGTYTVSLDVDGVAAVTGVVLTEGSTETRDFQIP